MSRRTIGTLLWAAVVGLGCGGETQQPGDCEPSASTRYFPLQTGATWTYRITDTGTGAVEDKVSTVGEIEDVGGAKAGTQAHKVTTEKLDGTTVSWQQDVDNKIVRHREQGLDLTGTVESDEFYDPYKVRIDETQLTDGATWTDIYTETSAGNPTPTEKTETWTVEGIDVEVMVPAGTFNAVILRRVSTTSTGGSDKTYWFVRGIGKVKEIGGQTEELVSCDLP